MTTYIRPPRGLPHICEVNDSRTICGRQVHLDWVVCSDEDRMCRDCMAEDRRRTKKDER